MLLPLIQTGQTSTSDWARLEDIALALAAAVDAKGHYTPSHSHAVARWSMIIGANLGIRGPALTRLRLAGLLHDVGKLHVPDAILLAPRRLTLEEYALVKHHPLAGHAMLLALGLENEARWVMHHHERGDGTGYPTGLAGDAIPLGSRILLVADAFDCMTTTRVYQAAMPVTAALGELQAHAGDQFDPAVVAALVSAVHESATRRAC